MERIIPQSMQTKNVEEAETTNTKQKETARVGLDNLDICPICSSMLTSAVANGHTVKVCYDHNIVLPVKD